MELGAVGDAHQVAVPRGLKVQTPKPDLESGREGVRAAYGVSLSPVLGAGHHRGGYWESDLEREAPYLVRQLSGLSTAGSKSMSVVRRARMVSSGDNGIYTGSGLRGVIPYIQCVAAVPEPSVLAVGFTSWSGEGVRSQIPGGGV
jgi:hypothetical protein